MQALSFWMVFFGAARGDRVRLEVTGPDGRIFAERDIVQEKDRARQFYFVGKRAKPDHLLAGVYSGKGDARARRRQRAGGRDRQKTNSW